MHSNLTNVEGFTQDGFAYQPSVVILMPAYNEAESIAAVIGEIRQLFDYPVVVIDDASEDQTAHEAAAAGALVIPLSVQLGAWGATQTGLRYALRKGFDICVTMDADGQHRSSNLNDLLTPVFDGEANVAIGTCVQRGSILRKLAWRLIKRSSGLSMADITSGYRVYDQLSMQKLSGWRATLLDYQDVGVLLLLMASSMRIVDIEVSMRPRGAGKSRIFNSWMVVCFYMCHTLLLGVSKRKVFRK